MTLPLRVILFLVLFIQDFTSFSTQAIAQAISKDDCESKIQGMIKANVVACEEIHPQKFFSFSKNLPHWLQNFEKKKVAEAMGLHRGQLLDILVTRSKAIDPHLNDHTALMGEKIRVFVKDGKSSCDSMKKNSALIGSLEQRCCSMSLAVPCLADTSFRLSVKKLNVQRDEKDREKKMGSDGVWLERARQEFRKKRFLETITYYQKALKANLKLTSNDYFQLAISYYLKKPQNCDKAIPLLTRLNKNYLVVDGDFPPFYIRRGKLLLAQCLAIEKKPDDSYLILDEMLAYPKLFEQELKVATKHRDFGWISSSAKYREFLSRAEEAFKPKKAQEISNPKKTE